MTKSESVADYFRAQGRRRLDRVDSRDHGGSARRALALLDAAAYAADLDDDDPLIAGLEAGGCFGPHGFDPFAPGPRGGEVIAAWESGEPWRLLLAVAAADQGSLRRV